MKTTILAFSSIAILFLTTTACHKNDAKNAVTQTTPAPTNHVAAKGKYTKKAKQDENTNNWDCSEAGSSCRVKLVVQNDPEVQEIAQLQQIIAQNGNGNAYFSTQNWSVLFDDDDPQTLLARIAANQVFLYQMSSVSNNGTTYGYSYVLSTATNIQGVNMNNTEGVWQY
jgi:hypothetical protein